VMGGGSGRKSPDGRLIHGGHWRDEQEWPLARTQFQSWHFHGSGLLAREPDGGQTAYSNYHYDPGNPVPSIGGSVSSHKDLPRDSIGASRSIQLGELPSIMEPGGFDQVETARFFGCKPPYLPLGSRADVLVFQSEPLTADMETTGPIEVKLWVSTSAVDTDFTAKLIDVYPPNEDYPDGYRLNLTDSIQRLSFRDGTGIKKLVKPGDVMEISINLYPTSNVFVKGHRIRVDISSSNFPRFDLNFNSGEPAGKAGRKVIAENRIYHDAVHPSCITLPVILH
jgi:predicted acyl esterase